MAALGDTAFVTLATNDPYALGALVLCHSLKETGTAHSIVCLITDGVSQEMIGRLERTFELVVSVAQIDSNDREMLELLRRPELGVTLTKLHVWRLTQFNKVVFLDADTLVLQNIDDLFDRPELSAAPDIGWPDCFNSGLFVCVPSEITFRALTSMLLTEGSFDGGDQGLLNQYFSQWSQQSECRLPFVYNVVPGVYYSYVPAVRRFYNDIKVIHFSGPAKPWASRANLMPAAYPDDLVNRWWAIHDRHMRGLATPGLPATAVSNGKSHPEAAPQRGAVVGTDPRTLSADRLAHMQAFQNYRISWEEVAQTAGRKLSLAAAPADGASAPRPRAEWMSAIISELQRLNDRVSELRRGGRRNENELERLEERVHDLTELLTALRNAQASGTA